MANMGAHFFFSILGFSLHLKGPGKTYKKKKSFIIDRLGHFEFLDFAKMAVFSHLRRLASYLHADDFNGCFLIGVVRKNPKLGFPNLALVLRFITNTQIELVGWGNGRF